VYLEVCMPKVLRVVFIVVMAFTLIAPPGLAPALHTTSRRPH
jgi:hypothetical protein